MEKLDIKFCVGFSYILKAQNSQDAERWIQYLQLSIAIENYRYNLFNDEHSLIYKSTNE